jgi:four helix bundle protein
MPAPSSNKKPEVYNLARKLVVDCYELTEDLPVEEKTNLTKYIRTAAVTVFLNIARGISLKKRKKKKKFIESAKNNLLVINAAMEALADVGLIQQEQIKPIVDSASALHRLLKKE